MFRNRSKHIDNIHEVDTCGSIVRDVYRPDTKNTKPEDGYLIKFLSSRMRLLRHQNAKGSPHLETRNHRPNSLVQIYSNFHIFMSIFRLALSEVGGRVGELKSHSHKRTRDAT
jgi:hypothetical protein